jgi:hypothetical protein
MRVTGPIMDMMMHEPESLPKQRWMSFFWGASTLGVASGLYATVTAALPLMDIPFDSRIPVVTGAGAPFVAGAGIAMILSGLASLWWAKSRIQKPLLRLGEAVDDAVSDGFSQQFSLPRIGIGPMLQHAADRLQAVTVSITDAGLEEGNSRLRVAFRGGAADRFENIMTSLKSVHETIVARESERDAMHEQALSRAELAAQKLEYSTSLHDAEQLRLRDAVKVSHSGLEAIRIQLSRLSEISPSDINAVVDGLRDQALAIDTMVTRNDAATVQVNTASHAFSTASQTITKSFDDLKQQLTQTANGARDLTTAREAELVSAVDQVKATLQQLETTLTVAGNEVAATSSTLRDAGQTLSATATDQSRAITTSVISMGRRADELVAGLHTDLQNTVAKVDSELASSMADARDTLGDAVAKVERLSDIADSVETRLNVSTDAAEAGFAETNVKFDTRLKQLTDHALSQFEAMVSDTDARLTGAVAGTGQSAVNALVAELAPVKGAATDHAAWLRAAMTQMREETERLSEAQQAAMAVRALSAATEAQLRGVSQTLTDNAEQMALATERAVHGVEKRTIDANRRMEVINTQAERATKVLADTIEPLVGLLGRTRNMLDNMAEIEQSQLAPALRRIQSGLTGIANQLEENEEMHLRKTGDIVRDQVRRSVAEFVAPVEAIGPAFEQQSGQIKALEAALVAVTARGEQLPNQLVKHVGTWCADQLRDASDRMIAAETGLEARIGLLSDALEELRTDTPKQIDRLISNVTQQFEARATNSDTGIEDALRMLQSSVEKQVATLIAAQENTPVIDMKAINTAAENAARSSISTLADSLKAQINDLTLIARAPQTGDQSAQDDSLGTQIERVCSLIEAVEHHATTIAHAAVADPAALAKMPDAVEALVSAERALGAWSRQIDNVSTAVAIAMDATMIAATA